MIFLQTGFYRISDASALFIMRFSCLSAVTQLSLRYGTSVSRRREKRPTAEGQVWHGGDMRFRAYPLLYYPLRYI